MIINQQFNQTVITSFVLLGFSLTEQSRFILFIILVIAYISTITANVFIIILIRAEPGLHKPMYFFIGGLSFLEIWYPSVTIPGLLQSLKTKDKYISFTNCLIQLYFHFALGAVEMFLLTAMSYDRYVAICNPLRYLTIMSPLICFVLMLAAWVGGFITVIGPVVKISFLSYCKENTIDHYYCDFAPIIHLSCSNPVEAENACLSAIIYVTVGSILLTLTSYIFITRTILKFPTALGRQKAFSTVVSHSFVVILFYGTILFMFVRKGGGDSLHFNKIVSIIPSVVTPFLNPIIYTLRNQEVKQAVVKIAGRIMAYQVEKTNKALFRNI
ncbi:olfactory receptor 6F1-like [Hyperolius riggenbachi]|uniref:olfactory receptor 6F1-like n=1 Tax=Hyperolius riggenbachi TaxID=752182 RepID=UPI0035A2A07A